MKTIINKIKEKKAIILKLLALLLIVAVISLVTLAILFATDVLNYDDGFVFNEHIFDSFKGKWYGFIIFILIQTVLSMLLCVIPGVAAAFVMFSTVLYPNPWDAFLLSYSCVLISSTFLYVIGKLGGYKICEKILGKDDCEKSLELLRTRGTVYFPLMMLFPIFPDDALVMIAGVTKMKLSWFIPSILLCRGVGAATIIFGMALVPFENFTTVYEWLILITIGFFWIQQLFKIANKVDRHFAKKRLEETNPAAAQQKIDSKNHLKIYLTVIAILISVILAAIPLVSLYDRLVITTVSFFWIKILFFNANDIIYYFTSKRFIRYKGAPETVNFDSVNTCHNIATVLICAGIAFIHFKNMTSVIDLIILVTVSFFWLGETFKAANKIDHYFAKRRLTEQKKLCGATEQTLEESMDIEV